MTSSPGVLREPPNNHSDGTDRHTDGTGVEPKGHLKKTGCSGADLRVLNDSFMFELKQLKDLRRRTLVMKSFYNQNLCLPCAPKADFQLNF